MSEPLQYACDEHGWCDYTPCPQCASHKSGMSNANQPIWKSHVFHGDKCFFVSTIERTYDTYAGSIRGPETLVWEYDWEKRERGDLIHQSGGVADHQTICRCIIAEGEIPDEDNPKHARFFANMKGQQ